MNNDPENARPLIKTISLETNMVNRQSKMPLHEQLYEILKGKIVRGDWGVGEMIPPESDLTEKYHVSRIVIRQVLNRLVNEGLIYRQQGRGSFIAKVSLEQGLTRIISFTEDMLRRGLIPGTKVVFASLIPAPEDVANKLNIPTGEEMVRLERLRLASEEPMSIEESYLIHRFCPGLLEGDYSRISLRQRLEQEFGIHISRALQTIRSVAATTDQARLLSIQPRSPLLFIERISFSQQNVPFEFIRIYYRGDRYSLYNELHD